jgi:hypothetical protein
MTRFYTEPCAFCEHPIETGQETHGVFTEWTHSDKNVCRQNIRADERERIASAIELTNCCLDGSEHIRCAIHKDRAAAIARETKETP